MSSWQGPTYHGLFTFTNQICVKAQEGSRFSDWTAVRTVGFSNKHKKQILPSPYRPERFLVPPNLLLSGYGSSFPILKRRECETSRLLPHSTEVYLRYLYMPSWSWHGQLHLYLKCKFIQRSYILWQWFMYLTFSLWLEHIILQIRASYVDIKDTIKLVRVWRVRNDKWHQPVRFTAFWSTYVICL